MPSESGTLKFSRLVFPIRDYQAGEDPNVKDYWG